MCVCVCIFCSFLRLLFLLWIALKKGALLCAGWFWIQKIIENMLLKLHWSERRISHQMALHSTNIIHLFLWLHWIECAGMQCMHARLISEVDVRMWWIFFFKIASSNVALFAFLQLSQFASFLLLSITSFFLLCCCSVSLSLSLWFRSHYTMHSSWA